jgi:lipopolysaccharide export system protein LptC
VETRTFIVVLLLAALAAASFFLIKRNGVGEEEASTGVIGGADYTMSDFTMTTMDLDGATQYRLTSAQLIHYEGATTAQFEQPDVTIYGEGRPVWHIVSDQGELTVTGDEVHLLGNVTISKINEDAAQPPVTIITRNLLLYPDQELARTDEGVEIKQASGTLWGTGMRANLAAQQFELLTDVRGWYVPATP